MTSTDTIEDIVAKITADIAAVSPATNVETYSDRMAALDGTIAKAVDAIPVSRLFGLLSGMEIDENAVVAVSDVSTMRNTARACLRTALRSLLQPALDGYRLAAVQHDFVWVLDNAVIAAEAVLNHSTLAPAHSVHIARTSLEALRAGHGDASTIRGALEAAGLLDNFLINSTVEERRDVSFNHGFDLVDIRDRAEHARLVESFAKGDAAFQEQLLARLAPNGPTTERLAVPG